MKNDSHFVIIHILSLFIISKREETKLIDYLLIGPLGWKKNIWNKLINHLKNQTYDFMEFSNRNIKKINLPTLQQELIEKLNLLKQDGVVITCSYGSTFFLHTLSFIRPTVKKVILIEGFEEIPDNSTIRTDLQCRKETFDSLTSYINIMLTEEEKQDPILYDIVTQTIHEDNGAFILDCTNAMMESYLSLLSGITQNTLIDNLKKQTFSYHIFSSTSLPNINYEKITEEEHLLMLSTPNKIIKLLK